MPKKPLLPCFALGRAPKTMFQMGLAHRFIKMVQEPEETTEWEGGSQQTQTKDLHEMQCHNKIGLLR